MRRLLWKDSWEDSLGKIERGNIRLLGRLLGEFLGKLLGEFLGRLLRGLLIEFHFSVQQVDGVDVACGMNTYLCTNSSTNKRSVF